MSDVYGKPIDISDYTVTEESPACIVHSYCPTSDPRTSLITLVSDNGLDDDGKQSYSFRFIKAHHFKTVFHDCSSAVQAYHLPAALPAMEDGYGFGPLNAKEVNLLLDLSSKISHLNHTTSYDHNVSPGIRGIVDNYCRAAGIADKLDSSRNRDQIDARLKVEAAREALNAHFESKPKKPESSMPQAAPEAERAPT